MKASSAQRWDLAVGGIACLIAVAGLLLSIALGNTKALPGVVVDSETQKMLAVPAAIFLLLVLVKAGVRFRRGSLAACAPSTKPHARQGASDR